MPDLVIGAKRPSAVRPLRVVAIAGLLVVVGLVVAYVVYRRVVSYAHPDGSVPNAPLVTGGDRPDPRLTWRDASLSHRGALWVLRSTGGPHDIGAARGRLEGPATAEAGRALLETIERSIPRDGWIDRLTYDARLRWRYRLLDDGIPGHHLVEIAGQVRGASRSGEHLGYEDSVHVQAALDVGEPAPWSSGSDLRAVARSLSLLAGTRGPRGDRLLIGRSFALPGVADGGRAAADTVVRFVRDDGDSDVIPHASVGWAGQVGVVTGVNAAGLAVMVHPVRTADVRVTRRAQPMSLLARDILEHARNLDDAVSVLEAADPLGAAAFVLVDGTARKWALVERSPTGIHVVRNPKRSVITDLLGGDEFVDDAEVDRARRTRPSAMRAERAAALLRSAPPEDAAGVAAILRDRRGPGDRVLPYGHRGTIDDPSAVHTVIVDPSAMMLWVSDGPGAAGAFRGFDLRHELAGSEPAAPPADIDPDPDVELARARAVLAARGELRAARRHAARGDRRRARELAARALARAPDLPEALLLAGDLAAADDDADAANRHYERYLEVGPDDLGAAERIRARLLNP